MSGDESFVDLHDIIQNYLPVVDGEIPWKRAGKVKWSIDRRFFHIHHGQVEHAGDNAAKVTKNSTELFKSTYQNTTDKDMEYSIDQTRQTVTSVECTISKGMRFGGSFELELTPPSIPSLKVGLNNEVEMTKDVCEAKQEEMSWTFQTRVSVPAHKAVRATLSVMEEKREGSFTMKSYFSGKILVDWEYKKKSGQITLSDLEHLLVGEKGRNRGYGFEKDKEGRIFFETKGVCSCHYGLEQLVTIREVELEDDPATEGEKRNSKA